MSALSQAALAIATIVLNGLWEGVVIVGIVWLGLRFAPNLGAATRYAIWIGALLALVAVPIFTSTAPAPNLATATGSMSVADTTPARESEAASKAVPTPVDATRFATTQDAALPHAAPIASIRAIAIPQTVAIGVTILWLLFASARVFRLVRDCERLAMIRRHARLWSTAHEFPILISDRVSVPLATGFRRRAIVLPTQLVRDFANADLEAIVIHELAHLRRNDVWTNLLARAAEAAAASSPATWFAMRQLSIAREIACDDWVVALTGSGSKFARTLAGLATLGSASTPIAAPSALGSRHAIVERIEHLLDARPRHLDYSRPVFGGTLVLLALIAIVLQTFAPALALESQSGHIARVELTAAASDPSAGSCAVPNRGIRLMYLFGKRRNAKGTLPMDLELERASAVRSDPSRPLNTTYEVTVDATGKLVRAKIISAPNVPGMTAHLTRLLAESTYAPAVKNCVPFTATVRTSTHVRSPEAFTRTIVTPIYPQGWSSRYPSSCKVPSETHARYRAGFVAPTSYTILLPAFPDSEKSIGIDTSFATIIRVSMNGTTATRAVVTQSSGRADFDRAALVAARNATYRRKSMNCEPLPPAYMWRTTFAYQAFP